MVLKNCMLENAQTEPIKPNEDKDINIVINDDNAYEMETIDDIDDSDDESKSLSDAELNDHEQIARVNKSWQSQNDVD